jgi:hypothetical protein
MFGILFYVLLVLLVFYRCCLDDLDTEDFEQGKEASVP